MCFLSYFVIVGIGIDARSRTMREVNAATMGQLKKTNENITYYNNYA
jgi:hypothetical protein